MKETNREVFDRGSLPELLANRARKSSDQRLAVDAGVGLLVAATVAVLRPPLWIPLTALAVCLGAYGIWGILDRETRDAESTVRRATILSWARGFVALLGVSAAILFGVSLFFAFLGPIIS